MDKRYFLKIVLCVLSLVILLFLGTISAMITSLITGKVFYGYVVAAMEFSLIIYMVIIKFGLVKKKALNRVLGIFLTICIVTTIGYVINQKFFKLDALENEQAVDLNKYKPFAIDTKVKSLKEDSSLNISDNMPILDGATALYPMYSSFAKAVYTQKDYNIYNSEVMCTTTSGAYNNLIEGKVDIIFVARPSQLQIEDAKKAGVELKLTPIGKEAFVFFVNSKNKVKGLSTKQIQDIYSGQTTNWKEVGGERDRIRAFQRSENSGSQTMLQKVMEGKKLMVPPKNDVVSAMDGIIRNTANYENYKNAMGYSFLFYATEMVQNNQIRLLEVDGVYPNRESIKSKKYPLAAEFYAVTAGSTNPNVEAFINWVLGTQGQYLIEETGYTPLN
jgi:phosphate transport system substrate-binding protein